MKKQKDKFNIHQQYDDPQQQYKSVKKTINSDYVSDLYQPK